MIRLLADEKPSAIVFDINFSATSQHDTALAEAIGYSNSLGVPVVLPTRIVNDNAQWDSISDVLGDVTSQVSSTGQISITGDGTNVALADLVSAAALQSSELQNVVDSSVISQRLAVVQHRNVQRFKTIEPFPGF